jgi:transketolase
MIIVQPCNAEETRQVVEFCVQEARESCAVRLAIGPSPRVVPLPEAYQLRFGRGTVITEGASGVLFAYGPVMLHEALVAAERLEAQGFDLRVINMPWLNRVDPAWLVEAVSAYPAIHVLEDHSPVAGLGDAILNTLVNAGALEGRPLRKFAVEGYPACGTPSEALQFHGLDGVSLATRIVRGRDAD